jgi:hypothetical protein
MKRFFTPEEINPKLNVLSKRFDEIQKEFFECKKNLIWTNWNGNNDYSKIGDSPYDGWKVAALLLEYENDSIINELKQNYNQNVEFDCKNSTFIFDNCKYFPILKSTLFEIGIKKRVGLSVVFPGKEIKWHTDPDPETQDFAIIRGLWTIDVNVDSYGECALYLGDERDPEKHYFKNNQFMFFWGRTNHKVVNTLQTPRYVLCFDQMISRDYLLSLGN